MEEAQIKPPLPKGGWLRAQPGGYMDRKHNPGLTANAKSLRQNMTKEERHLWYDFLRNYPTRFLRQKVIDRYIVDFYCHDAKLIIELDGSQHFEDQNIEKDQLRTSAFQSRGLEVVRIANNEITQNFRGVCDYIDMIVKSRL